jgi:hypothetical protein
LPEIVEGWLPRRANMFKRLDNIIIDHGQLCIADFSLWVIATLLHLHDRVASVVMH